MALLEQLTNDMKDALKKGEKARLTVLRTTLAQCKDEKIRLRRELTDEDVLSVLGKAVKTRNESLQLYKQGGRQDLVEKEQNEIDILQNYLPEQLSEEEIRKVIENIVKSSGAESMKDIGKVMGPAMQELKGKADGKLVQQIARSFLDQ